MGLFLYKWSRTAASNATADSNVNMAEGMAPSAVNDGVRAAMASVAGWRDDISGAIATGGSSTAYTVTSYQVFDSLANMSGHMVAFVPHTTSGAAPTLNVDGLGAKSLRQFPSVDMPAGVLVQGTPYVATYNNSDSAWYLQNSFVNPYQVPLGGMLDYTGSSAPNSAFVIPIGQAISRTTYATYFSLVSTTYGVGDGSTTFNVPDLTGRVVAMKESGATRLTTAGGGVDGGTLGAVGGSQNQTLTSANIPSLTSSGSNSISVTSSVSTIASGATNGNLLTNGSGGYYGAGALTQQTIGAISSSGSNSISVTYTNASPTAVKTVQPTIILNKILRVL